MKLGGAHPMGPFTLLDVVGLDTTYYIATSCSRNSRNSIRASLLAEAHVHCGLAWKKSGKGSTIGRIECAVPQDAALRGLR